MYVSLFHFTPLKNKWLCCEADTFGGVFMDFSKEKVGLSVKTVYP